jgi:hypothetical protein
MCEDELCIQVVCLICFEEFVVSLFMAASYSVASLGFVHFLT